MRALDGIELEIEAANQRIRADNERLYLLWERTAIKHFDGGIPLAEAERQAREELGPRQRRIGESE